MKKMSKLVALALALVMALSLTVTAGAEETTTAQDMAGSIVILHTNDVHSMYGGTTEKGTACCAASALAGPGAVCA